MKLFTVDCHVWFSTFKPQEDEHKNTVRTKLCVGLEISWEKCDCMCICVRTVILVWAVGCCCDLLLVGNTWKLNHLSWFILKNQEKLSCMVHKGHNCSTWHFLSTPSRCYSCFFWQHFSSSLQYHSLKLQLWLLTVALHVWRSPVGSAPVLAALSHGSQSLLGSTWDLMGSSNFKVF